MIDLEGGDDFKCPKCGHGWSIRSWHTEYGHPVPGDHKVFCTKCNKYFHLYVEINVTTTTEELL